MKSKVHIFASIIPLRAGETVAANCGDVVVRAQIIHAWDHTATGARMEWPSIGICAKCIKSASKKHDERVFCYAVVSAE